MVATIPTPDRGRGQAEAGIRYIGLIAFLDIMPPKKKRGQLAASITPVRASIQHMNQ